LVSLLDLASKETPDISGDPLIYIPLLRFTVALTTRAIEVKGLCWDSGSDLYGIYESGAMGGALKEYLQEHRALFDIWDEDRPFLQIPASQFPTDTVKGSNTYPLRRISSTDVAGSNGFKMDLQLTSMEDSATIAQLLLQLQIFAPGYKKGIGSEAYGTPIGVRTVSPSPCWAWGYGKGAKGVHHLMLQGKGALETIMLNMFSQEVLSEVFPKGLGVPYWEKDASKIDPSVGADVTLFYDFMVPAYHKYVRLEEDTLVYAGACTIDIPHDILLYQYGVSRSYKDKDTKALVTVSEYHRTPEKNLFWRELGAFLGLVHAGGMSALLDEGKLESYPTVNLRSMGVGGVDESSGLYRFGYVEDSSVVVPLDPGALRERRILQARGCRVADRGFDKVKKALWFYAKDARLDAGKLQGKYLPVYWEELALKKELITKDLTAWGKEVKRAMLAVLARLPAQSSRDIEIRSKHMAILRRQKI
jgi:hypothetical protein